ncbi:uncharacterized protein LOC114125013 [Aphis gossypii]|uniref:uncharacterized protein LOC114125013 n=1 Tax=Aphis gossypii TaxID=80765 RepID=UPI002158C11B|nr:uncharacterized protein LOC114125013 [Aphis gossypii]
MFSHVTISFVCVSLAVFVSSASVPAVQQPPQQQQQQRQEDGFGSVLWSVLDDCFFGDGDAASPATVCLKSKALTALDRALGKSAVTLADGLTLSARAGKSLAVDPQAERAERAALDAAPDADSKSALLDDMLASRMDRLMSTRTIVMDGAGQEGRGKKKDKAMQQAMMMAGMTAAAVMGPMALKIIALIAAKALLLSKIALVLSGITVLKKLMQPQQGGGHETESSSHHYGRSMQLEGVAHHMAYSSQKQ